MKVRSLVNEYDVVKGGIYEVIEIDNSDHSVEIYDDVGDKYYYLGHGQWEEYTEQEKELEPDLASLAKKHGIKITETIGSMSITYDGSK